MLDTSFTLSQLLNSPMTRKPFSDLTRQMSSLLIWDSAMIHNIVLADGWKKQVFS